MNLTRLDTSATHGDSSLHRAAPLAKLIAFAALIVAIAISTNVLLVATIAASLLAVVAGMRLPARPMLALSAYAGVFAALFAFAAGLDALGAALVIGKAITAGLAAVTLMFTTPYPQVFAPIQRLVPPVLGDALLMTYRSLFLLLDKFASTLTAVRLRAGLRSGAPVRSAVAVSRALSGVLLYSVDMSQRTHDVMYLRGYDGRLVVTTSPSSSRAIDATVVAAAVSISVIAVTWRIWWTALNPFSWIPLGTAVLALIAVAFVSALRKARR